MAQHPLLSTAWQRTELRGPKKIFSTVGVGVLVVIWYWFIGLRAWDSTKWFLICVPAAWFSLTIMEFLGHLGLAWISMQWTALVGQVRSEVTREVARIVHEEAQASRPQRRNSRPTEEQLAALDDYLLGKQSFAISVKSQTGNPGAYQAAQALIACFTKHQWTVDNGSENFPSLHGYFVLVYDEQGPMPHNVAKACEALTASGISLRVSELQLLDLNEGFIFVAKD